MSTIVTRTGKGSSLTWTEADANFTNLNTDKIQVSTITGTAGKTTPVDADIVPIIDSVGTVLNKVTWANIKATLKIYFDTLYTAISTCLPLTGGTLTGGVLFKYGLNNVASASPLVLTGINANTAHVTGTTGFSSLTMTSGQVIDLIFDGILTLTHHAFTNNLPGGANITTAAGDRARYWYDGTAVWCVAYVRADGTAVVAATSTPVVRQTVLKGPVDTAGLPTFLPATSGNLNLTSQNVSTGANALVATAAQGFGASGAVDVIGVSTANLTWTGCTANNTNYLPVSISGGALTALTPVILPPIYQFGGTPSVTANQYTFNIQQMTMYLGNGSTASAVNHVIVGECVAGASTITSSVAYGYMGRFVGGWNGTLPGTATQISANHNLGTVPPVSACGIEFECVTADLNYSTGDKVYGVVTNYGSYLHPLMMQPTTKAIAAITGSSTAVMIINKTTGVTAAPAANTNFKYRFTAQRGW